MGDRYNYSFLVYRNAAAPTQRTSLHHMRYLIIPGSNLLDAGGIRRIKNLQNTNVYENYFLGK